MPDADPPPNHPDAAPIPVDIVLPPVFLETCAVRGIDPAAAAQRLLEFYGEVGRRPAAFP